MKEGTVNKIFILFALSLIFVAFVYQCHPAQPNRRDTGKSEMNSPPVRLDEIQEGSLVRRISGSEFYELLPQLETNVEINVDGMVGTTTIDQTFTNSSGGPIEAVYVFPLPRNAAVHDMKMLINDRLIQGVIKEREVARKTYVTEKARGKRAGLMEQERPNIFTSSVANIMPGDTVIVRLAYVEKLHYEDGAFTLRFPMVVAPRYIPGRSLDYSGAYSGNGWAYDTDSVPDASRITPPVAPPGVRSGTMLSLTVNVNAGLPIASIESVSHDIHTLQVDRSSYRVQLERKQTIPNRDFILEYRIQPGDEPQAALFAAQKGKDHYFMLMTMPPEEGRKDRTLKKEMVFVLDISGSMQGTSIVQAKDGLINALKLLAQQDYFNIITFHDDHDVFAPYSVRASTVNIMNAINYVNGLEAEGGTEARPALRHALTLPRQPGAIKMIIFLTDGSVGNENDLIALVNRHIGKSRLFTVGIGSAPNGHLLEQISHAGRGTFTCIADADEVLERMDGLFSKIENPVLSDLRLDMPDDVRIFPDPVPDLFAGQPLIIFGKTDSVPPDTARLFGKSGDSYVTIEVPLDFSTATRGPAIPTLWARSVIADLMYEYRLGNEDVTQDIIDVAIDHNLLTKFTAFVAVEQKIVNPRGSARLRTIPAELPEGWVYEKVREEERQESSPVRLAYLPQTASQAPLVAAAGFILILAGTLATFITLRRRSGRTIVLRRP